MYLLNTYHAVALASVIKRLQQDLLPWSPTRINCMTHSKHYVDQCYLFYQFKFDPMRCIKMQRPSFHYSRANVSQFYQYIHRDQWFFHLSLDNVLMEVYLHGESISSVEVVSLLLVPVFG